MSQSDLIATNLQPTAEGCDSLVMREKEHGTLLILDYDEFYLRHAPRLYNVARRILKDHELAEDAVQEAFNNIFQNLKRFRGESRLETWMTRIVVNVCLGYLRKHRNRLKAEVDPEFFGMAMESIFPDHRNTPFDATRRGEVLAMVHRSIRRLKKIHRDVIYLHDIKEKTLEEISRLLDVPVGTIKSRLFYGRQELRNSMKNLLTRQAYHLN